MDVQTMLNFHGRTEAAMAFYNRAIEAETLFLMRFRERPDYDRSRPDLDDKIFHATFRVGTTEIMASDCGCESSSAEKKFAGFSLALRVETPEKAERFFNALGEGGQVQMPLQETFYASRYGIVLDRFGVSWKVMVESGKNVS
jgi:PhnB protein